MILTIIGKSPASLVGPIMAPSDPSESGVRSTSAPLPQTVKYAGLASYQQKQSDKFAATIFAVEIEPMFISAFESRKTYRSR